MYKFMRRPSLVVLTAIDVCFLFLALFLEFNWTLYRILLYRQNQCLTIYQKAKSTREVGKKQETSNGNGQKSFAIVWVSFSCCFSFDCCSWHYLWWLLSRLPSTTRKPLPFLLRSRRCVNKKLYLPPWERDHLGMENQTKARPTSFSA